MITPERKKEVIAQYGNGKSEEALGWLLPESGATPYLSTKFGVDVGNLRDIPGEIEASLSGSLARLKRTTRAVKNVLLDSKKTVSRDAPGPVPPSVAAGDCPWRTGARPSSRTSRLSSW